MQVVVNRFLVSDVKSSLAGGEEFVPQWCLTYLYTWHLKGSGNASFSLCSKILVVRRKNIKSLYSQ